jgi:DNA-binding transcriptional regulator of glucitol operon
MLIIIIIIVIIILMFLVCLPLSAWQAKLYFNHIAYFKDL